MDDLTYSITDDSSEPAEVLADALSRDEAILRLLQSEISLHHLYVTCWDKSEVKEHGTHPIFWENADEFLADNFNIPVASQTWETEVQRALEEAFQCLTRVAPLLLDIDEPEEYRYVKAVGHRVQVALREGVQPEPEAVADLRSVSLRKAMIGETESLRDALSDSEIQDARRGMMYCMEFDTQDYEHLDFSELGEIIDCLLEAAQ
jgi:hypothetical protein